MKISVILTILIGLNFFVDQSDFALEKEIDKRTDFISIDQLGFLYLVNGTELTKIDLDTDKEENYSNVLSGRINKIDTSDPFKTLIFYKDFNRIEFLNKDFTSITTPIQLDDLGYFNVLSACQSVNGGFWIFDQSLSQLIFIDKNRNTVKRSTQLPNLIGQNIEEKQIYMLEKNDYIYLGIPGVGILLFDSYGTYIKTFPTVNAGVFQVNNEIISYNYKGKVFFYNTTNYNESHLVLPKHECKQALIEKGRLFIQTKEKIYIYKLNN